MLCCFIPFKLITDSFITQSIYHDVCILILKNTYFIVYILIVPILDA